MIATYWGVRGSIPVPGETTLRYGGNTSCVTVEMGDRIVVIDAGTGIRRLGASLAGTDLEIFVLLTHLHQDHIQGFPLFHPLYEKGRTVHALEYAQGELRWSPVQLLDGIHFPLRPLNLPSFCECVTADAMIFLRQHGIDVSRLAVNHPGGAYGYRFEESGSVFVHIPDNEIDAPGASGPSFEELAEFCRGADVLSHDAQFLPEEMHERRGWGHTEVTRACDLAVAAGAGHLVLFHHDPDRSDDELDALQARAKELLDPHDIACTAAYEGLRIAL